MLFGQIHHIKDAKYLNHLIFLVRPRLLVLPASCEGYNPSELIISSKFINRVVKKNTEMATQLSRSTSPALKKTEINV
jgi:hypothetical protein